MLQAGSGSEFSYNDYNNDNDNSNVSSHIATNKIISTNPASGQKTNNNLNGVGNRKMNTTYKAKANEKIK